MSGPVLLYPAGAIDWFKHRLETLGFAIRTFQPNSITELNHSTVDWVFMVPDEVLESRVWRRVRVDLARSNRFFLALIRKVTTRTVVACMRDGAQDVLSEEDAVSVWQEAIQQIVHHQQLWVELYGGRPLGAKDLLVGRSTSIHQLRRNIERIGPTNASVLLLGESGVGKERVASALHKAGSGGPFVPLNCAAIPRDLLESELFGVERGAFTGAGRSRPGLVEQASGGTLFLDEIGEMDPGVQPKVLRFLETRRARRVGGEQEYAVDLRVISATNRQLDQEIAAGRFRVDLYYRLGEIILQVPPLRSHPEDIPDLARVFLRSSNERFGKNFQQLEPELILRLQQYGWPGNVRELKSVIDRMVILFDGPVLRSSWWDWPVPAPHTHAKAGATSDGPLPPAAEGGHEMRGPRPGPRRDTAAKLEQAKALLAESGERYGWVATQLGVHPSTLFRWRQAGKL